VDRAQLIQEMLAARSPDELERVQALANSWLARHPDDVEVLYASEQVAMLMRAVQSTSTGDEQRAEEVAEAPGWTSRFLKRWRVL
jgi:hypothetical protein